MIADAAAPSSASRLTAIDVFRGVTIAGMLLVNNPGDPATTYAPLRHNVWNGCSAADLVFPFFLFVVGITTHVSLSRRLSQGDDAATIRRHAVRRGAILILLGLLLNWYPFLQSGTIAGQSHPTVIDRVAERLLHLRFLGVLQRIGIAYLAAVALSWRASVSRVMLTVGVLLLGYWMVMTLVPVPPNGVIGSLALADPTRTVAAWLDAVALDWTRIGLGDHRWDGAGGVDPEGLLSTIPAIATTLIGVLAGRWLSTTRPLTSRAKGLFAAGVAGISAGLAWGLVFPINKPIWSSSYVLFTAGLAAVTLALVMWVVSVKGRDRWSRPFLVFGTNSILAYVGSELSANVLHSSIKPMLAGHHVPTGIWVTHWLVDLGAGARAASLAYATVFVVAWFALLVQADRRGIHLRV